MVNDITLEVTAEACTRLHEARDRSSMISAAYGAAEAHRYNDSLARALCMIVPMGGKLMTDGNDSFYLASTCGLQVGMIFSADSLEKVATRLDWDISEFAPTTRTHLPVTGEWSCHS